MAAALTQLVEQDQLLTALRDRGLAVQVLPDGAWQLPGFAYYPAEDRCTFAQGVIFAGCSVESKARLLAKFAEACQ